MNAAVIDKVRQTVAEVFSVDLAQVSSETSPESVPAWDSIGHLNLLLALEQRFGITFDPEELPHILTVQALADAISAKSG